MEDIMNWRKSSYSSSNGGECIEVADDTSRHHVMATSRVLVRDTKDKVGPMLRFTPDAWRTFAMQLKSLASDT
jgi:hypothetical protein